MHGIKQKLCSRTGASITYGLLLFLVCAILSSVIIAAASASAGRMSRLPEADQRYYAVTSASELIQQLLEKTSTVTVIKKTDTNVATTYEYDEAGAQLSANTAPTTTVTSTYLVDKSVASGEGVTVSSDVVAANEISAASLTMTKYAAKLIATRDPSETKTDVNLSLSWKDDLAFLGVDITESIDAEGNITVTVSQKDDSGKEMIKQVLLFTVNVTNGGLPQEKSYSTVTATPTTGSMAYTVTETTTDYAATTYQWTLTSVKTTETTPSGS